MKHVALRFLFLFLFSQGFLAFGQKIMEASSGKVQLGAEGNILWMCLGDSDTISFRTDKWYGPAFENVSLKEKSDLYFEGEKDGIVYGLRYLLRNDLLSVTATVWNVSDSIVLPEKIRLRLGIDTYMDKFPRWNKRYFPTLLRSEATHFWSYLMTPLGKILALASPDAIASWAYNYEQYPQKFQGKTGFFGEHRIYTVSLDLLHRLPLPERHPRHLYALAPGQTHSVELFLMSVASLDEVKPVVAAFSEAPVPDADFYTLEEGKPFRGTICAPGDFNIEITSPRNEVFDIPSIASGNDLYSWSFRPVSGTGVYTMRLYARNGKITECKLYVRPSLDVYLVGARKEALRNLPTSTHHAECFYPFYTYFLARRYVPESGADGEAEKVFTTLYPQLFDNSTGEMREGKYRIQDAATMAGILADRYRVNGDEKALADAARLVDFLIRCQEKDGGYYNPAHHVHYTSVIYLAKSIMEVMVEEKRLAATNKVWQENYERHLKSVRAAMDNLAEKKDDIQTEGQMTFEDGMISCSVAQLAMAALKENDKKRKQLYTEVARELNFKHRCLTQLLQPDCRMNGATLRFWEFQYTINLLSNGMNSPCGWSAWNVYGNWYLYLLTGEYDYLREAFNGLGSCLQLYHPESGELRFGFIPDPCLDAVQFMETPKGSGKPVVERIRVGEQYLAQISNWHKHPDAAWRKKWGIDNFVHEVFKCMAEIALSNAYIIEHKDGRLEGVNCNVVKEGNSLLVTTQEPLVKNLHVNLKNKYSIKVLFGEKQDYKNVAGMQWLGNIPEELVIF